MVQKQKKPRGDTQPSLRDRAATLRSRVPSHEPDPVLTVIKDGRRLLEVCRKTSRLPATVEGSRPAADNEAISDLLEYLRETILQMPPETPVGAVALAKLAVEISAFWLDDQIAEELISVLKLIAEVRLA